MEVKIEYLIDNDAWLMFLNDKHRAEINDIAKSTIRYLDDEHKEKLQKTFFTKHFEISMLLTDDPTIRELNNKFRDKDKITNILSFPDSDNVFTDVQNLNNLFLGDIAASFDVVAFEASSCNISFREHFYHLFVHSLLHLFGFDHTSDAEASIMEDKEIAILAKFGIKSPY